MMLVQKDLWIRDSITPSDIYLHQVCRLLEDRQSPYQRITVADGGPYGKKLFLDNIVQSATGDEFIYHETLVHPAMLVAAATKPPKQVLILGGGEGATLREVLRWNSIERVIMVDIDPMVIETCRKYLPEMHQGSFDDPRAEVVFGDAIAYLRNTKEHWDVIISDITEPVEAGPSNFCFTREYFSLARQRVIEGGVLVTQSGPVSPIVIRMHARVTKTLQQIFANVSSYAVGVASYAQPWGFTLASDCPIVDKLMPASVNAMLGQFLNSPLRFLDGNCIFGLLQMPIYVRKAIASEVRIYTDADWPSGVFE